MSFNRSNPSPRYRELQRMYQQLHEQGEANLGLPPQHTFNGMSLLPQLSRIKGLIQRTGANTVLDYGCGKGQQYDIRPFAGPDGMTYESVMDFWDVTAVHCYDPCYGPYSKLPEGHFDGVVCTDVLEHCPESDVPWIIDEIFGYADRFVYANVACYPAQKRLPNGENAHCTIKPLNWWNDILANAASRRPGLIWEVWVRFQEQSPEGPRFTEACIGNG